MANQRSTFAKRQREMGLKDKANAKLARRAAKRAAEPSPTKGPPIAWDEIVHPVMTDDLPAAAIANDTAGDDDDVPASDQPAAQPTQQAGNRRTP